MIDIIAHRGYWKTITEKNSLAAFERAFDNDFGIETDLRDCCGEIVISHDPPTGHEVTFEELLKTLAGRNLTLALNIKADGLGNSILKILNKYNHTNYFTFDMSIPDMVSQKKSGLKIFTGKSDIVKQPIMYENADGVWLDSFYEDWFSQEEIYGIIKDRKKLCIVSPELHERKPEPVWEKYKNINNIMLCTDYPEKARQFFNE